MKVLIRIALVCAGLCVLLAVGVGACVVHVASDGDWSLDGWPSAWQSKAERTQTHALEFPQTGELAVLVSAGEVRVRASGSDAPSLIAHITARGRNDEEAQKLLAATVLDVTSSPAGVQIGSRFADGASDRSRPTIDLEIVVPAQTRLKLDTGSGNIEASGAGFGAARLESDYGSISITGVRGELYARSSSGSIAVDDVQGARCEVHSNYGSLTLARIEADVLEAVTKSGAIKASTVRAVSSSLESGYGQIALDDIDGGLVAKSSSGSIQAVKLRTGPFELASKYGAIKVSDAHGTLEAKTASGRIEIERFEGAAVAETSYGALQIDGVLDGLVARTSSGSIALVARPGSQLQSAWKITSGYGNVSLELPPDLAFELAADTGYGTIDLGFEISVRAGGLRSGKQLTGVVNDGSQRLEVATKSGSIAIQPARD